MKKLLIFLLMFSQLFILTGCWGDRTIIDQTLITGFGIDFKDNQYIVTVQALNFSNIAKQEGGAVQVPAPPLIGQAKGKTIQSAFNIIEERSPIPLYYGHVSSIILSKSVIENKMNEVNSFISGRPLLRYTVWIYGTERNIKDIFASQSFFNLPFLYTVVDNPDERSRGSLILLSLKFHQFISRYTQPVGTILIPLLDIDEQVFKEKKEENDKVAFINGAFAISQKKFKGQLTLKDLNSLNYMKQENYSTTLLLKKDKVNLEVRNSKGSVKVIKGGKKPKYIIKVKTEVAISQNENLLSNKEISSKANKKIKNEILKTIKKGEELQADLLNISEKPYRFNRHDWTIKAMNDVNMDSIKDIKVHVRILGSKAYKR
ncbi:MULTISPECIES: Ger(x)C family spore germination protein [unclassified Bacillus (in: firmicutes)]|uniref:Ger(x)C family spore germination protein n=1 Tax=unclassified Bacillus (in: firmicutes) TaxID=185979 RepID=UPI0008DEECB1|nr:MULTISPECIES: Ger(x)C family spore germination protein [unclassified Bacillus (in: firmicutes)]PGZ93123.1 Ger(x)C family spore germination protein [Bacillus sp. AFS029533]SFD36023.1 germination protein, Ger(x)C family [Bacillus sp. UNCCL81]